MKTHYKLLLTLMIAILISTSCNTHTEKEVWKTELIHQRNEHLEIIDSMTDHSQYLILHKDGEAELIDSTKNELRSKSKTTWEIQERNNQSVFLFGFGKEEQGILGVAYPITFKNEKNFNMRFDTLNELHIWNLRRVE